jgi:hypothetical protein
VTLDTSSVGGTLQLNTQNDGTITVDTTTGLGDVFAATLILSADGDGDIDSNSGRLRATLLNLRSGTGDIGFSGDNVQTRATTLDAITTGNVFITEFDGLSLNTSSAGDIFDITIGATFNLASSVTANNVAVRTSAGSNGNLSVNTNPIAADSITLHAGGTGNILNGTAVVGAPLVILQTDPSVFWTRIPWK